MVCKAWLEKWQLVGGSDSPFLRRAAWRNQHQQRKHPALQLAGRGQGPGDLCARQTPLHRMAAALHWPLAAERHNRSAKRLAHAPHAPQSGLEEIRALQLLMGPDIFSRTLKILAGLTNRQGPMPGGRGSQTPRHHSAITIFKSNQMIATSAQLAQT